MSVATLAPGDDITAIVRVACGESLTIRVMPGLDPLAMALTRAALAPLAIEAAPMRVNAVLSVPGALSAEVDAAILFFESAVSTTGQWLDVA